MYVTGRLALLVALGVIPLILLHAAGAAPWAVVGGWLVLCAGLAAADTLLAADARALEITRRLPDRDLRDRLTRLGARVVLVRRQGDEAELTGVVLAAVGKVPDALAVLAGLDPDGVTGLGDLHGLGDGFPGGGLPAGIIVGSLGMPRIDIVLGGLTRHDADGCGDGGQQA